MADPPQYTIRFADKTDVNAVAELLAAMDAYYDELSDDADYAAMVAQTIATREGTRFVLCLSERNPVGLAGFAILRPGRDLKGLLFVKDLFVRTEWRGKGVGRDLMRFLADFAITQGIDRIDLATDVGNDGARRLYQSLGGIVRPAAVYFTFPESALRKMTE